MSKVLLDTSVIIDFLRRKDKSDTLFYKLLKEELYVSIVTHTEIYSGRSVWEKTEVKKEVEQLFSSLGILPLVNEISVSAGKIKAVNYNRTILDCIIGTTALYYDLVLATLNRKDFEDIKGIKLLDF